MLEFQKLVYLDLQKTGSRFVKEFLRCFSATAEIASTNGLPRAAGRKDGAVHVISVRHPLPHYLSLYCYGCERKGGLYQRMNGEGRGGVYDGSQAGFESWLALLLSPYSPYAGSRRFGFQTTRFLSLALPGYRRLLQGAATAEEIGAVLHRSGLVDVVLKQESLNDDLAALASAAPELFRDREQIPAWLAKTGRTNQSRPLAIDVAAIPEELLLSLRRREWLLLDLLGFA